MSTTVTLGRVSVDATSFDVAAFEAAGFDAAGLEAAGLEAAGFEANGFAANGAGAPGVPLVGSPTRTRTRRAPRRRAGAARTRQVPVAVRACSLDGVRPAADRFARVTPTSVRPAAVPVALTRRGRVVALVLLLLAASGALSMGVSAATTGAPSDTAVVYQTLTVGPGESLWSIARAAAPEADPRATIARIVELNGLDGAGGVRAGQQLTVPVVR